MAMEFLYKINLFKEVREIFKLKQKAPDKCSLRFRIHNNARNRGNFVEK